MEILYLLWLFLIVDSLDMFFDLRLELRASTFNSWEIGLLQEVWESIVALPLLYLMSDALTVVAVVNDNYYLKSFAILTFPVGSSDV